MRETPRSGGHGGHRNWRLVGLLHAVVRAGSPNSISTSVDSQRFSERNRGREDRADLCLRKKNKGSDENKLEMRKPRWLGAQLGGRLGLVIKQAPGFPGPMTVMVPQLSLLTRGNFLSVPCVQDAARRLMCGISWDSPKTLRGRDHHPMPQRSHLGRSQLVNGRARFLWLHSHTLYLPGFANAHGVQGGPRVARFP